MFLNNLNFKIMKIKEVRLIKETEYTELLSDSNQTIGITHHPIGIGKLKIVDNCTEYGVPVIDIINKPLSDWRIDVK